MSLPNDPDAMRTWHGDVWLDEFAFFFDQTNTLKAARGCLKPGEKQLIITSTPNGQQGEYHKIWKRENEQNKYWSTHKIPYTDCTIKRFREDINIEKEEAIEDGNLDGWKQEYCCEFVDESSILYSWDLIGSCVGKTDLDNSVKIDYFGVDFGQKVDETVLRMVGRMGDSIVVLKRKFVTTAGYTEQLNAIRQLIKEINPIRVYIDKTAIGIRLNEELQESDVSQYIEPVHFNPETKEHMAMFIYSKMTAGKVILPNDQKLLDQTHGIKRNKTASGRRQYTHEAHKHDDEFWAMCLALMGYIEDTTTDNAKIVTCGNIPRRAKGKTRKEQHQKKKGYHMGGHKLWD